MAAVDGSCLGNPGAAAWCWYVDDQHWACGGWEQSTNNVAELTAVLELLRATRGEDEALTIVADSQYVIKSMTQWIHGWKRNGWMTAAKKPVANAEIIRAIDEELRGRDVEFTWVRGHDGHVLNEAADTRARACAEAIRDGRQPDCGPGLRLAPPSVDEDGDSGDIDSAHLDGVRCDSEAEDAEQSRGADIVDLFSFTAPRQERVAPAIVSTPASDSTENHRFGEYSTGGFSASDHRMRRYRHHGVDIVEHRVRVPLDYANPESDTIELFAREVTRGDSSTKPAIIFMQGGPGGRAPRPGDFRDGWIGRALDTHRVILMDERGTGLSTRLDHLTLSALDTVDAQVDYLTHFRADSMVEDAETLRHLLNGGKPWATLGQSYGGFINTTYLSRHPEGLSAAYFTGGLPGLTSIDTIYRATYRATEVRNREYFTRYPDDDATLRDILTHLATHEEILPTGERLTPGRLRMLGMLLGTATGFDQLHYFFEGPFTHVRGERRLTTQFLDMVWRQVSMNDSPMYALLHESIYAGALSSLHGQATNWSAWRLAQAAGSDGVSEGFALDADPRDTSTPIYLTGEHIYPFIFDEDPALTPMRQIAHALAAKTDWGTLYDLDVLADARVPASAAVYAEDMFVPLELSLDTARAAGVRTWVTNEYQHDGLRVGGGEVLSRLIDLAVD